MYKIHPLPYTVRQARPFTQRKLPVPPLMIQALVEAGVTWAGWYDLPKLVKKYNEVCSFTRRFS